MPHSLDVMHITKNVCESLLGTLLNMPEKNKDGPKARNNLKKMGIREELHGGPPKSSEETEGKGKKVKKDDKGKKLRRNIIAPLLLHSKTEGDRSIFQVPCRNQS